MNADLRWSQALSPVCVREGRLKCGANGFGVRFVGVVGASFPSPAEEELGDNISLDTLLVHNRASTFLLKVSGDSMIEAGILPGDIVIIDTSLKPKPNDIVIACVDGTWTMKYFNMDSGGVVLLPANPEYGPIRPKGQLIIHSVVTSSLRTYR